MGMSRKFNRQKTMMPKINKPPQAHGIWLSQKEYEKLKQDITNDVSRDAIAKVLSISCCLLLFHFGELRKKDTRLQKYHDMFKELLEIADKPTQEMLEAEQKLYEVTGTKILREEK
jgi:hypothetical protein